MVSSPDDTYPPFRLLIADDDSVLRQTMGKLYTRAGYDVVLSDSGEQAIHYAQEQDFDLVLIDLNMPERCGRDTLASLQRHAPATPVVILFALGDWEVYEDVVKHADRYLTKPLRQQTLLAMVSETLGKNSDPIKD